MDLAKLRHLLPFANQGFASFTNLFIFVLAGSQLSPSDYASLTLIHVPAVILFSVLESAVIFQINKLKLQRENVARRIAGLILTAALFPLALYTTCKILFFQLPYVSLVIVYVTSYAIKETASRLSNIYDEGCDGLVLNLSTLFLLAFYTLSGDVSIINIITSFLAPALIMMLLKGKSIWRLGSNISDFIKILVGGKHLIFSSLLTSLRSQLFIIICLFWFADEEITLINYNRQLITPLFFLNTLIISAKGHWLADQVRGSKMLYERKRLIYMLATTLLVILVFSIVSIFGERSIVDSLKFNNEIFALWSIWLTIALYKNICQYEMVVFSLNQRIFWLNLVTSINTLGGLMMVGFMNAYLFVPVILIASDLIFILISKALSSPKDESL